MPRYLALGLSLLLVIPVLGQTSSPQYQPSTITNVIAHTTGDHTQNENGKQYDVSVKIGDTVYVVLYTQPAGKYGVQFAAGQNILVAIGTDHLAFHDVLGNAIEVPILRREGLPAQAGIDFSKLPGDYFSIRKERLTTALALTPDQQARINPILEQESGEAGEIFGNPALSREDKLKKLESIIRSSDDKLKPLLAGGQVEKLAELRKEQQQELKRLLAEAKH
jgi:F0F1-type ATP synthase delta subunit